MAEGEAYTVRLSRMSMGLDVLSTRTESARSEAEFQAIPSRGCLENPLSRLTVVTPNSRKFWFERSLRKPWITRAQSPMNMQNVSMSGAEDP